MRHLDTIETVSVCTGAGYGPITMAFPTDGDGEITAESLALRADDDGEVRVFAYAPNAGNELDDWHVVVYERECPGITWELEFNPITPIRYGVLSVTDTKCLESAAELLCASVDYPILDEDGWSTYESERAYEWVAVECESAGVDTDRVWELVSECPEPYYTDNGGVQVPELDDIIGSVKRVTL